MTRSMSSSQMLAAIACAVIAVAPISAWGQQPVTAFVNVAVIPMNQEQVLAGQTVLVRGHTIAAVGPTARIKVPPGARRVDGQGKFLMPGLGDMHAHLFPLSREDRKGIPEWYARPRLFCYVANGVTTIRLLDHDTASAELRRSVAAGEIIGPRISLVVTIDPSTSNDAIAVYLPAVKAAGYDFARISSFQQTVLDSVATVGRAAGVRLAGDVPNVIGIEGALSTPYASIDRLQSYLEYLAPDARFQYGPMETSIRWDSVLTLTQAPPIDESKIPAIAAETERAGVWNVPMQAQAERMLDLWAGPGTAERSPVTAIRRRLIKGLHAAGAGLLLGTDAPTWGANYGSAVHQELERLVASGLTPYQALETSTRNVAAFLGVSDSAGTVAAGQWADLVLVSGNPLEDIRSTTRITGVMVNGQWLSRTQIDAQLKTQDCAIR